VSKQFGINVGFTFSSVPSPLNRDVSLCLYRITQEALHNVARHSGAAEASVRLAADGDGLRLDIADPGVGFDPRVQKTGLGLVSMRERVAFVGGTLDIDAWPGGGTRLDVRVPLIPAFKGSFPPLHPVVGGT
jgi:signal transduction histidine kinase